MSTERYSLAHQVSVKTLRELLDKLNDDDVLVPNTVGNLKIERDGQYIGFIDLLVHRVHRPARDASGTWRYFKVEPPLKEKG